jgi:hypothetical protein
VEDFLVIKCPPIINLKIKVKDGMPITIKKGGKWMERKIDQRCAANKEEGRRGG